MEECARECKICFSSDPTEWIAPCRCLGTLQWVHQTCLQAYIRTSGKVACQECGTEYHMESKPKIVWDEYARNFFQLSRKLFLALFVLWMWAPFLLMRHFTEFPFAQGGMVVVTFAFIGAMVGFRFYRFRRVVFSQQPYILWDSFIIGVGWFVILSIVACSIVYYFTAYRPDVYLAVEVLRNTVIILMLNTINFIESMPSITQHLESHYSYAVGRVRSVS